MWPALPQQQLTLPLPLPLTQLLLTLPATLPVAGDQLPLPNAGLRARQASIFPERDASQCRVHPKANAAEP